MSFRRSSDGSGEEKDLDERHDLQGREVGEDGLQCANKDWSPKLPGPPKRSHTKTLAPPGETYFYITKKGRTAF